MSITGIPEKNASKRGPVPVKLPMVLSVRSRERTADGSIRAIRISNISSAEYPISEVAGIGLPVYFSRILITNNNAVRIEETIRG